MTDTDPLDSLAASVSALLASVDEALTSQAAALRSLVTAAEQQGARLDALLASLTAMSDQQRRSAERLSIVEQMVRNLHQPRSRRVAVSAVDPTSHVGPDRTSRLRPLLARACQDALEARDLTSPAYIPDVLEHLRTRHPLTATLTFSRSTLQKALEESDTLTVGRLRSPGRPGRPPVYVWLRAKPPAGVPDSAAKLGSAEYDPLADLPDPNVPGSIEAWLNDE